MFLFKNRKIHVDCFTNIGIYATDNPIQKASEFIPNWWKNLKATVDLKDSNGIVIPAPTMKSCMGFIDLYRSGFIIPMWSDLYFKIENNNFSYQFSSKMGSIAHHSPFQYNYAYKHLVHFKIEVPWFFKEKTGVKFSVSSCIWTMLEKMPKISLLSGVVDFKYQPSCNINGFSSLENQPYQYNIEAGTPMLHLIPFSEKEVVPHIHTLSIEEYQKMLHRMQPYKSLRWGLSRKKLLKQKNSSW